MKNAGLSVFCSPVGSCGADPRRVASRDDRALVLDELLDAVDDEEAEHRRLEERKKGARDSRGEKGEGP
jgi:hypothetical protein